jgi:hypothetical protein
MTAAARAGLSGPSRRTMVPTSLPGTYRIAMYSIPSASPASNTGMICGSSTAAAARDSRMNRVRNASSAASTGARTFSATSRSSRSSRARYTAAMPPRPSSCSSRYSPTRAPAGQAARDPSRDTGTGGRFITHDLSPPESWMAGHFTCLHPRRVPHNRASEPTRSPAQTARSRRGPQT